MFLSLLSLHSQFSLLVSYFPWLLGMSLLLLRLRVSTLLSLPSWRSVGKPFLCSILSMSTKYTNHFSHKQMVPKRDRFCLAWSFWLLGLIHKDGLASSNDTFWAHFPDLGSSILFQGEILCWKIDLMYIERSWDWVWCGFHLSSPWML